MTTAIELARTGNASDEADIRAFFDDWANAIRTKDVGQSLAHYSPDVLAFDLIDPLQYAGLDALRERLQNWFSSFAGPIGFATRDLSIATGDEVAFSHSLNHVDGTTTEGQKVDMWWRATTGFRETDGKWLVAHSHTSVPFDMKAGRHRSISSRRTY